MSEGAGAASRVLVSVLVIAGVLAGAVAVAKWIQRGGEARTGGAADVEAPEAPDAAGASEDAGTAVDARDAAPPAPTVCDGIAKEIEATASRLASKLAVDAAGGFTTVMPDLFRGAHCVATRAGGAWALVPIDARAAKRAPPDAGAEEPLAFETFWEVVYLTPGGARHGLPEVPIVSNAMQSLDLEAPVAFDFDGDGEDEVIVAGTRWDAGGASTPFGRVWTFKGERIELYAPAPAFGAVEDVDDDDRPDLLTHGAYFAVVSSSCSGVERSVSGPMLVAHARPDGGFTTNDAVAVAFAKRRCPSRPTFLVASSAEGGGAGVDAGGPYGDSVERLVCARLWGASEADLTARVARECKSLGPRGEDGGAGDGGACEGDDDADVLCDAWPTLRAWLKNPPPLTLK